MFLDTRYHLRQQRAGFSAELHAITGDGEWSMALENQGGALASANLRRRSAKPCRAHRRAASMAAFNANKLV